MKRSAIRKGVKRPDPVLTPMKRTWGQHARAGICAMCGATRHLSGHHVLPLQQLKHHNVPKELWFDLDNQLVLCVDPAPNRCHDRHERWIKRIPRERVPQCAWDFAKRLELAWVLDHEYPELLEEAA